MKTLQFKCKLLSDVILNVKSASEGNNETLDFIPGNNFLGIVASALYGNDDPDVMEIIHSGKVRFGDAHPAVGGLRTLRVPADMFYPKLSSPSEACYLHHAYDREKDVKAHGVAMQLKQCRSGFYAFSEGKGIPSVNGKSFAIKSAYDYSARRSKDEAMFGYESLNAGLEMLFEVEVDNDSLAEKVTANLVGEKHVGRSRSAQYGSVLIEPYQFGQPVSGQSLGNEIVIYADSRLIFYDVQTCLPTFQPTISDLCLTSGEIDWSRSQIRTFQYSPWNSTRRSFDQDRCGIEKGSVIVVKGCSDAEFQSRYVGSYRNEGFGKVIYNPDFLAVADHATNGEAKYVLASDGDRGCTLNKVENPLDGTALLRYVAAAKMRHDSLEDIYCMVNDFVEKKGRKFKGEAFASQWGAVRSIASSCCSADELEHMLFFVSHDDSVKSGYLKHGVGKKKWSSDNRDAIFKVWFDNVKRAHPDMVVEAVVNLAAEMSKLCKRQ